MLISGALYFLWLIKWCKESRIKRKDLKMLWNVEPLNEDYKANHFNT